VPELPEVETVRRMLESSVRGRTVRAVRLSGLKLRARVTRGLPRRLRGRTIATVGRHGKWLVIGLDDGLTLLSHLGMSGRWLFFPDAADRSLPHVHAHLAFEGGGHLLYQDARRFGLLRLVETAKLPRDPALRTLGPDPLLTPRGAAELHVLARGARVAIKNFLLDQRRIAGIGNIYASEILFRARVDPRRRAGRLTRAEWERVAVEIPSVLTEAIDRMGTTFSAYRTLWGEPGGFGERLRVYDRPGRPCPRCGTPIRRIVQGQRSTFFCPSCQRGRG
jgi:formamidopyrimidine-DNA glycosylase